MGYSPNEIFQELIKSEEKTMETICRHVAAGGTLPGLCDVWGVRYADIVHWMNQDKKRNDSYASAISARGEWGKETVFEELRRMAASRITDFFDDDGNFTPPKTWTPEMKGLIKEIKFDDNGKVVLVKFWNKEKALELLGKNMEMFKETHIVNGKMTLEDLVQLSREDESKDEQ